MSAAAVAARLLAEKPALAEEVTASLYHEMPELLERHGEPGRGKCLQDMHYNIEHLAPAVELEEPEMFARYARWLDQLLTARNVSTREVVRCLELMEERVRARFTETEAAAVVPCIRAGADALRPRGGGT